MSSILAEELIDAIKKYPDYEVIMNIHHRYDISKESGKKGWLAYINGVNIDSNHRVIKLMN